MFEKKYNLDERMLKFAANVGKFINQLPTNQLLKEYSRQLIRSSASIGANYEEADGTLTKKDFINKIGIARRESRESKYCLKLIKKVELVNKKEQLELLEKLIKESNELMLILSSIINKCKGNKVDNCL
jgi:four helix bundle protein